MSLLLDALKRAEESKRSRESGGTSAETTPGARQEIADVGLSLEQRHETASPHSADAVAPAAPAIQSTAKAGHRAATAATAVPVMPPAASKVTSRSTESDEAAKRAMAQSVFAAKQENTGPANRWWVAPLIAVLLFTIGGAGWFGWNFWQQYNRYNVSPVLAKPTMPTSTPATLPTPVTPAEPTTATTAPQSASGAAIPLPGAATEAAQQAEIKDGQPSVKTPTVATSKRNGAKDAQRAPRSAKRAKPTTATAQQQEITIAAVTPAPSLLREVSPTPPSADLVSAYDALRLGNYALAQQRYQAVVAADPFNIDAHIGLATAAARKGESAIAVEHYRQVLAIDPRNNTAIASLAMLKRAANPGSAEIELRTQIAKAPNSAGLQFSLGNLYASQRRWTEAQQAYFEAYRLEPRNADFVFNLAVSLDQLNQPRLAREYYQSALTLHAETGGQFDSTAVMRRLTQLGGKGEAR